MQLFYLRFSLIIGDYVSCLLEKLVEEIHKKCNKQRDCGSREVWCGCLCGRKAPINKEDCVLKKTGDRSW